MSTITTARLLRARREFDDLARFLVCMALAKNDPTHAAIIFKERHPRSVSLPTIDRVTKAAVAAGTTSDGSFASGLIQNTMLSRAVIEYSNATSIVGRLSSRFKSVPVLSSIPRATTGVTSSWVAEGQATPAVSGAMESVLFTKPSKLVVTALASQELAKLAEAVAILRELLNTSIVESTDRAFLDAGAGTAGLRPASVLNGAQSVAATATFATDFKALVNLITTDLKDPVLLMRPKVATALAAIDSQLTRNAKVEGGDIAGIPIITSTNVPTDSDSPGDNQIVLLDAAEVLFSDGGIEIDTSRQASVQMDTAPDSPPVASTVQVSLWQSDLLAVKLLRFINWQMRRPGSVAVLTGVNY